MLSKKIKKDIAFSKIFETPLEKGDFVRFPYGKKIWKVSYVSRDGERVNISTLLSYSERWYFKHNKYPFYKVGKDIVIRFLCLNSPSVLSRFREEDLKPFFKKNLKEV